MSITLLFDLDNTLLDTNLESFVPAYFRALSSHLAPYVASDVMLPALLSATNLMVENNDPSRTLQEVFESSFYPGIDVSKIELVHVLEDFYDRIFPELRSLYRPFPDAAPLIDWALSRGFNVAIATDPIFPKKATYHRLRWAGFDPGQFQLISTFEDFHFSKTTPAYYAEILGYMGWPDGPILMVGNDIQRDLIPANTLGLATYFISKDDLPGPGFESGRGHLKDLRPWLESIDISKLEPSYGARDAAISILLSTPAVLKTMTRELSDSEWMIESSHDDWAMNEIVSHLRDTEREVHASQLDLMLVKDDAFIPRPDSSVWANERDYQHEKGPQALGDFLLSRMKNIGKIVGLPAGVWSRKIRHAIFGPTTFLEAVTFIADHDRMHVNQSIQALARLRNERV